MRGAARASSSGHDAPASDSIQLYESNSFLSRTSEASPSIALISLHDRSSTSSCASAHTPPMLRRRLDDRLSDVRHGARWSNPEMAVMRLQCRLMVVRTGGRRVSCGRLSSELMPSFSSDSVRCSGLSSATAPAIPPAAGGNPRPARWHEHFLLRATLFLVETTPAIRRDTEAHRPTEGLRTGRDARRRRSLKVCGDAGHSMRKGV